jgi:hypothetical protein
MLRQEQMSAPQVQLRAELGEYDVPTRRIRRDDFEGREPRRFADRATESVRTVVNQKAAKELGIAIPHSVLVRARI